MSDRNKKSRGRRNLVAERKLALQQFATAAHGANLVTFDLFDTLLRRRCGAPEAVFYIVAERLQASHPEHAERFVEARIRAEARARALAAERARNDIGLDDILAELEREFSSTRSRDTMSLFRNLECEVEVAAIEADPEVKAVFDRVVEAGLRVALVSDMYLPEACIIDMLDSVGIVGQERLFLSNACGAAKANGSMWELVRRQLVLAPGARIVHLGDNPDADGATARRCGIDSFVLPNAAPATGAMPTWLGKSLLALHHRSKPDDEAHAASANAYWREVANTVVFPSVLGLSAFIREVGARFGTERVFFLARDGLIFQKAFEATRAGGEPRSRYVWASRRCLNVAAIFELDEIDLDYLTSGRHPLTPHDYLRRIDLDLSRDVESIIRKHFPDPSAPLGTPQERAQLRAMLRDLASSILARAQWEREGLCAHLDEIGLFEAPAIIVDLGWHGTLQRSLMRLGARLRGIPPDLVGVYLGTLADRPREAAGVPMQAFGWLFHDGEPQEVLAATVGQSFEVIELLFSAPEAGVRYVSGEAGVLSPIRNEIDREEAMRLDVAAVIHAAVMQSAEALGPLARWIRADAYKSTATESLARLLSEPADRDVAHFSSIEHAEGFGRATYRTIIGSPPALRNPKALLQAYRDSFWPRAFLQNVRPPLNWAVPVMASWQERLWQLRSSRGSP